MQKYRVYELAKMFGKTNEEVIRTLQKNNVNVKTNFNSVGEKEKDLLEKAFSGKEPRKNTHRTIRTVRFDRQGRPAGRKADESHHSSYSSYKVEQPQEVKKESNRDTVKTEDRHVSSYRGEERRTSSEHRSYKDRDNNRFSHRSGDRNQHRRDLDLSRKYHLNHRQYCTLTHWCEPQQRQKLPRRRPSGQRPARRQSKWHDEKAFSGPGANGYSGTAGTAEAFQNAS